MTFLYKVAATLTIALFIISPKLWVVATLKLICSFTTKKNILSFKNLNVRRFSLC